MSYHVTCDCGRSVPVAATDAGSSAPCGCGRAVEVPPLHVLKHAAGEEALSADARLETLLGAGVFPRGADCVRCHRPTDHRVTVRLTCDRPVVKESGDKAAVWTWFVLGWLVGLLVWLRFRPEVRTFGRDVEYLVPLRVCPACDAESRSPAGLVGLLRAVPESAAVLEKYPKAEVGRMT